ncbi:ABC transporter permease [Xanthobacter sp. V7C-4]|uniref:ABC transporter permease n=1 Tax=Xanthobacter autotrophicus (strain ATCC BAA-1158 / Py2) TaxID=78245 RepID=UPI00372C63E3
MKSAAAKSSVKMQTPLHIAGTAEAALPRPPAGSILLRPERPAVGVVVPPDRSLPGLARRWLRLNMQAIRATLLGALAIGLFILAWHVVTVNRMDLYVRFLNVPSPEQVLESARTAFSTGTFFDHIVISCRRIFLGFALAALVAVPMGLLMGRYALIKEFVFPVCEVLRPIPAIAWVPMSIMLWPTNEQSIVFITFLGAFFPVLLNTLHGMANVDEVLVRAARCLGASERATFREVYFPAVLPQIFTGLTVGMGVAWVSLIAAEMISGQFGIGYFTWEAYSLVQYPDIALGMITIGVLGLASSFLIRLVGRAVTPWSRAK